MNLKPITNCNTKRRKYLKQILIENGLGFKFMHKLHTLSQYISQSGKYHRFFTIKLKSGITKSIQNRH